MKTILFLFWLGVAGAAGTLARYGLFRLARKFYPAAAYDLGIFTANVAGSFLAGVLCGALLRDSSWREPYGVLLLFGFCGAFTTFSTVMVECSRLTLNGNITAALINLTMHNFCGLAAAMLGLHLMRIVMR